MRAAIYARVIMADGRQDPEDHLVELCRFASAQGWDVVVEYIDHESGGLAGRTRIPVDVRGRGSISKRVRAGLSQAKEKETKTGRPVGRPRAIFRRA